MYGNNNAVGGHMADYAAYFVIVALGLVVLFHLYWGGGGRLMADAVIPAKPASGGPQKLFSPSSIAAFIVAGYLSAIMLLAWFVARKQPLVLGLGTLRIVLGIAGAIFVIRAIGDFRYIGFFKRVYGTRFARWDNWLFSPFILCVGAACVVLAFG
jgi:hypothetical protein